MQKQAVLALSDGSVFRGRAIGADGQTCGELVFNTAMTGYQEILTDPSYSGQIVTLTYPHIGNVGVNALDIESERIQAAGLVVRDVPNRYSSWRGEKSLGDYLKENGIIGIADVDTRELTRRLRISGTQNACIMSGAGIDDLVAIDAARAHPSMQGMDLASEIGIKTAQDWTQSEWQASNNSYPEKNDGKFHVVAYDFGIKYNILRLLVANNCRVTLVPATTTAEEALALKPDGIFLSNGPADPQPMERAIATIAELIAVDNLPIFGICLGHQLLALAGGAQTIKMKFGHHGANHPVVDIDSGAVMITSQNHGFAVDEASLPEHIQPTHRSLFDRSLQGIAWKNKPIFAFQGHPEASPGPLDARSLFARFVQAMEKNYS